ncbi:hypothetical protein WOB59_09420 [Methylocystis sp. IM4]|uniref:Ppx/GppA phosphatase family protein n=1 Tax=Methylocystis sp. IM4 TaxID=3136560 RepID=UPI003119F28C
MLERFLRSRPVEQPAPSAVRPVAIVDIGSNSVRLVAYQGLSRAPTPIFNEKAMCGLGKGVVTTGRLPEEGVEKALKALRRYRALCSMMGVLDIEVIATAAARDAQNGPAFLDAARDAIGREISLLPGRREAELSALGIVSSIHQPDGVVGDLGGGSLELIDVKGDALGNGVTLPLGGLALMDASRRSPRRRRASPARPSRAPSPWNSSRAAPSMRWAAPGARWRSCTCASVTIRSA